MIRNTLFTISTLGIGIIVAFVLTNGVHLIATSSSQIDLVTFLTKSINITPAASAESHESQEVNEALLEEDPHAVLEPFSTSSATGEGDKKLDISATSYIVVDQSSGEVVVEHDADRALPIASVTKLVTAMVARTEMNMETRIEITPAMLTAYGNTARLRLGETYRVDELLYPLLMVSSNDAAEVLAQSFGSVGFARKEFVKEMNNWANSVGAYHSYFYDPSGLSANDVSSARDVSIIMRSIATRDPYLLDIMRTKVKNLRTHTWTNPTHFLNLSTYRGGKNGYTTEAGRTGVSLFEVTKGGVNHTYIIVILNSKNRDHDTLELLNYIQ